MARPVRDRHGMRPRRRRSCRFFGTRGRQPPQRHRARASAAPISSGQSPSQTLAGMRASAAIPPIAGSSGQGIRMAAIATENQRPDCPRRSRRLAAVRNGPRQALQEMQHEKRRADRREIGEQADKAVAQRRLDRELGQRAAGQGQSAEAECEDGRQEQRRPQAARVVTATTPTARNSAPFARTWFAA